VAGLPPYAIALYDPLVHAALAAAVVAPAVPRAGRGPLLTGIAAGTLIDLDHPVAARSLSPAAMLSLDARPRSHSVLLALGTGAVCGAVGGPVHGWAALAGLGSHLLRDAAGGGAPTPLLWPWARSRRIARRWALAGTAALAVGSWAVSRAAADRPARRDAAGAGGGGAGARPRTASGLS
jgi:membrane-bound metal-dependent hydrolase YbcI (DUF457 family)